MRFWEYLKARFRDWWARREWQMAKAWRIFHRKIQRVGHDTARAQEIAADFFRTCLFAGGSPWIEFEPPAPGHTKILGASDAEAPQATSASEYLFRSLAFDLSNDPRLWKIAILTFPEIRVHEGEISDSPWQVDSFHPVLHVYRVPGETAVQFTEERWHTGRLLGMALFENLEKDAADDQREYLSYFDGRREEARNDFAFMAAAILTGQVKRRSVMFSNNHSFRRRWAIVNAQCDRYLNMPLPAQDDGRLLLWAPPKMSNRYQVYAVVIVALCAAILAWFYRDNLFQ